ncbi:MAG: pyruvate kinase [Chlorobi bacterium]|nr:pyruvate kinase [Chlorobiota bacterium]MCI0715400.1 pyruvate kinase [Chlorobiota bacterium]
MVTGKKKTYKNTKILATLGPASDSVKKIIELIESGIDGVRLNFSHGSHQYYEQVFKNVNDACVAASEPIAILIDLQGPKIRVGELKLHEYELRNNENVEITMEDIIGTNERFTCSYKGLVNDAKPGDNIFIDDGLIKLKIVSKNDGSIFCKVIEGGILKPRKGMNFPGVELNLPSLTKKDYNDLDFALTHRVDFIALSFVRKVEDILELRKYLVNKGFDKNIIAKIEKPEAVKNFDEILIVSDGIMIARGDLGVELPPQEVPVIQKSIIRKCNNKGIMVITATQMLESMINYAVPTRAETSDVANAVWDGTDVVMLSGETSVGKYPAAAVEMMNDILVETESNMDLVKIERMDNPSSLSDTVFISVGRALTTMAVQLGAEAIVSFTRTGRITKAMSKFRPSTRIIALSDSFEVMNILRLVWGIIPIYFEDIPDEIEAIKTATTLLRESNLVNKGGTVIFTSGAPMDEKGKDIWIRFAKA